VDGVPFFAMQQSPLFIIACVAFYAALALALRLERMDDILNFNLGVFLG
jgi:hypothetical protein